jgi:hypothetical protein
MYSLLDVSLWKQSPCASTLATMKYQQYAVRIQSPPHSNLTHKTPAILPDHEMR